MRLIEVSEYPELVQKLNHYYLWDLMVRFARQLYGDALYKVKIETWGEYDDSAAYNYDIRDLTGYDVDGRRLPYTRTPFTSALLEHFELEDIADLEWEEHVCGFSVGKDAPFVAWDALPHWHSWDDIPTETFCIDEPPEVGQIWEGYD